jgi:hypothetical protein
MLVEARADKQPVDRRGLHAPAGCLRRSGLLLQAVPAPRRTHLVVLEHGLLRAVDSVPHQDSTVFTCGGEVRLVLHPVGQVPHLQRAAMTAGGGARSGAQRPQPRPAPSWPR